MEGDFRNTLIIISAVVIAAIFIHGFITIRRNKNPYKLKTTNEKVEPVERGFDGSGFDQDGVSEVRVVGEQKPEEVKETLANQPKDLIKDRKPKPRPQKPSFIPTINTEIDIDDEPVIEEFDYSADSDISSQHKPAQSDISLTASGAKDTETVEQTPFDEVGDDIDGFDYSAEFKEEAVVEKPVIETPIYQTPITQEKPSVRSEAKAEPKAAAKPAAKAVPKTQKKTTVSKKEAIKRNQFELNFGDPVDEGDMPSMSALDEPISTKRELERPTVEPEVLAVSIVMPDGEYISGAALLPTLLTLGLRYGDMDIFHRHQDNAGNGKVTFSLANIMNPGTFDLDALENFNTRGLTLFMTLPNAGDPFEVFQHMLNAAKQISIEFGAQLLDDKRSVMTKQTEQHYTSKIREFERKNRIAYA